MTGDLLGAALAYAGRGWPVFPCRPGAKVPNTAHGFLDATTDPGVIRAWWTGHARDNVAIATGSPALDVLDVDVKPSGSGFEALNRVKRTGLLSGAQRLVRTRSGGLHLYFAGTGQECGRLPRHHLDFKAAGGYVLAPPSFVGADDTGPAGAYELLDERDSAARLDWQSVRRALDGPARPRPRTPRTDVGAAALVAWVAELTKGNRNAGLYWAACRANGDAGVLDELVAAAVTAGLPEMEARRTAASAAKRIAG